MRGELIAEKVEDAEDGIGIPRRVGHDLSGLEFRLTGRTSSAAIKASAATINYFDKGKAIYITMPSAASVMEPVLNHLLDSEKIQRGPDTPEGVYTRRVEKRILYVNSTTARQTVVIPGYWREVWNGSQVHETLILKLYDVQLLEPVKGLQLDKVMQSWTQFMRSPKQSTRNSELCPAAERPRSSCNL